MQYKVEISTASLPLIPSLMYRMQGTYKMECALASATLFIPYLLALLKFGGRLRKTSLQSLHEHSVGTA